MQTILKSLKKLFQKIDIVFYVLASLTLILLTVLTILLIVSEDASYLFKNKQYQWYLGAILLAILLPWKLFLEIAFKSALKISKSRRLKTASKREYTNIIPNQYKKHLVPIFRSIILLSVYIYVGFAFFYKRIYEYNYSESWVPDFVALLRAVYLGVGLLIIKSILQSMFTNKFNEIQNNAVKTINNISTKYFFGITFTPTTISVILSGLIIATISYFFFGQNEAIWYQANPYAHPTYARLSLYEIRPDEREAYGTITISPNTSSEEWFNQETHIDINGKEYPIRNSWVYGEVKLTFTGNEYLYPFVNYELSHLNISGKWSENFLFEASTNSTGWKVYKGKQESFRGFYNISLSPAPYVKIIYLTMLLTLLVFLWAIWNAKERGQIIDLSLGVFVALFTVRSFIVPNYINSPILLDHLIAFYLIVLMVSFFYRYKALEHSNPKT